MREMRTKIMVPVDFTTHTKKLVEYALHLAKALEAEVKFVHVVESFAGYDMLLVHPSYKQMTADLKVKADEHMANLLKDNKGKVEDLAGEVLSGDVVDRLLEYAEEEDFDMIIVGTHGSKGLEKVLMGSVATKLSKKAPCPILVVNPISYLLHKWERAAGK